jgi:hypothetical protein
MGCTYVGFELPGKINKLRRDAYDYGMANIRGCKAMLCLMRDKLLQCNKRKTTRPSAHEPIQLVTMLNLSQQYRQTCKAWGQLGHAQQDHAHNVSSQLQVCGVRFVDPRQEVLQGKAGWYPVLGCGEEVHLGSEELCGHSNETIAIKGV